MLDYHKDRWRRALRTYVTALPVEAQNELGALVYVGRGDSNSNDEWELLVKRAAGIHEVGLHVISKEPAIRRYITEGMKKLGHPMLDWVIAEEVQSDE